MGDLRIARMRLRRPFHVKLRAEDFHSEWFSDFYTVHPTSWRPLIISPATRTVLLKIVERSPVYFANSLDVTKAEFKNLVCSRFKLDSCDSWQIMVSCSGTVKLFIGTLRDIICQEIIVVYMYNDV